MPGGLDNPGAHGPPAQRTVSTGDFSSDAGVNDARDLDVRPLRIGVLALQGDYAAHAAALRSAAASTGKPLTVVLIRKPIELDSIDGLVLPGGESTTFLKFLDRDGFLGALQSFTTTRPTFGTCAGSILLATEVIHPAQESLGVLDATIERNAYGRQNDSTILHAHTELGGPPLEMVFIRAPRFSRVGAGVRVLAERAGSPALIEQGHLLAATFHPELSLDTRVHLYFLEKVRAFCASARSGAPR